MNFVIDKFDNQPACTCPVSGLKIFQKPEWRDISLAKGYKITISLLGNGIIFLQPQGYAGLKDTEKVVRLTTDILGQVDNENRPYVQLADYSLLTGASLEARRYFIDYLKSQRRLLGMVFFNVSPIMKLSIKLARRLNRINFNVRIADNYDAAVRVAQKLLDDCRTEAVDTPASVDSTTFDPSFPKTATKRLIQRPDWHLEFENFSLRFEVLNDNTLHAISTGRLEKNHVVPSLKLQEKITRSAGFSAGTYYFVLGLKDSAGTSQRARKQYVNAILRLFKKYPFRMFVFYGANRLVKAGINLARPFVPFKVAIADNLEQALELVAEDEAQNSGVADFSDTEGSIPKPFAESPIQQYVNELLEFLEEINWDGEGSDNKRKRDPAHPFSSVFDAIELIKWEFDDLIREKQRSEEKIRRAKTLAEKANSAKSEFLANMSHELRTPLNHIIGFTELVVDKNFGELNEVQEEYLGDVLQSGKHLLALINDILDLSKVEAGKQKLERSTFSPLPLLESCLSMVREKSLKHSLQLSLDTTGIPETIRADERMLKQIMYNLLSNATKFTPQGGNISVTASACELDSEISGVDEGAQCRAIKISVSDTGIGVRPADLKRIFDPFEQVESSHSRRYQGTGLGLSLCRNFVDLHGGKIWAESQGPGQGTSFHFVIPVQ